MTLSEKITYLRKREGMSQEDLAEKLSISRQSIYKWENGESLPSFDKIKFIAKLFNVSFDFLMDDSISNISSSTNETKNVERSVFSTGIRLTFDQINIDNGYHETRKAKLEYSDYYADNIRHAKNELKKLNITDVFQVHGATFFFYDSINYTCGFFYAGMIQFVCPIENILGFTYRGGDHKVMNSFATVGGVGLGAGGINSVGIGQMPTLNSIPDTTAWCSLSYKCGDSIKQIDLEFSVNNKYMALECCKSVEDLDFFLMTHMNILLKDLEKLKLKILSLVNVGIDIKKGNIKAEEVDHNIFTTANEVLEKKYSEYLKKIEESAIQDNKVRSITMLLVGGIIAIFAFIFIVGIFRNL